jgi:methylamine dehydrogenase accessory protein MauD
LTGWWLVSYVVLWAFVVALAVVLLVVLRQLGLVYLRQEGGSATAHGPEAGKTLGTLTFSDELTGDQHVIPDGSTAATLVLFVSPDCGVCRDVVPADGELAGIGDRSVYVISRGDGDLNGDLRAKVDPALSFVTSNSLQRDVGVELVPWAVIISREGTILQSQPVNRVTDLRAMLDRLDRARDLAVIPTTA